MRLQIDGLTSEERNLLDVIWGMDTREELAAYYRKQNKRTRQKIDVLIELLRLAMTDQQVDKDKHTLDACRLLKEIGIDCYGA